MKDYPNREALRKAHDIYRDAMRPFIVRCLKRVQGERVEDLILDSLPDAEAEQFESNLQKNDGNIEATIDISHFPHIIRKYWHRDRAFSQQFDPNSKVQYKTGTIAGGRNLWAHPGVEDLDIKDTQAELTYVAQILGEINNSNAKEAVEDIHDRLVSGESRPEEEIAALKEQIADITKQRDAAKADKTEAEVERTEYEELLGTVEKEKIEIEKQLEDKSNQLNIAKAGKTVAEERLSDISNRFEEAEIENANLEKCLSETENRLRTVESEKDELKECLETTLTRLEDVEEELAGCKAEREEWNGKVVAPIPPIEFPYTGPQLRDYRIKAGLTQVAVVLALGLSKSAAAAVGDWEAERVKVPPKHYAKLKELYGLEVLPGNGKARKKKSSIAERYAAETTEEERNELAVKVAELRINEEGTQGLAWRKIREELNLKNDEFHKVIRHEDHYKESCIQRIESFEGGWEYGGKLEVLLGFDPVGELLDRIEACKPASKVEEPVKTEDPNEVPSYRGDTAKSPKRQRKWRRPGAVAALRDPAKIRQAEAKIANILNLREKTRLERELREAKQAVYGSEI